MGLPVPLLDDRRRANGLVQAQLDSGRPVLRSGEALVAKTSGVAARRDLGDSEATVFWVLQDS